MDEKFYSAFEDRHRGSRDLIKSRLNFYLPFIEIIKELYTNPKAIDLGCGRGEWLEMLNQNGFETHGVDVDDHMLESCRQRGLSTNKQDLIEYLKSLEDESQTVVSAFHVVEHIELEALSEVIKEAKRVLKPCGLLILETPNPENLIVSSVNFYLDPTHQRPIPPALLSFLTEYAGFKQNKIVRLQENKELLDKKEIEMIDILTGVSPDYAVIAQKEGIKQSLEKFDLVFNNNYGIELAWLAHWYEQRMKYHFLGLANSLQQIKNDFNGLQLNQENNLREISHKQVNMEECLNQQLDEIKLIVEQQKAMIFETTQIIQQKNHEISNLVNSKSWRITTPLRAVRNITVRIFRKLKILSS